MDKPKMVEILAVSEETATHRTFTLDAELDAKPGQFVMVWLPGVDEKPMSISKTDGKLEVTVKKVGDFTKRLFTLSEGDKVGIRGPYGNHFKKHAGKALLVGGGCGTAPLRPLADVVEGDVIISARTKDELLFEDYFRKKGFNVHVSTDDGSKGFKGFAHELLIKLSGDSRYDCVYVCGPEMMMRKVMDFCLQERIPVQLSLERFMKCGIGICGSCSLAGLRVCKEGPVFSGEFLVGTEFGHYTKDGSGSRVKHGGC